MINEEQIKKEINAAIEHIKECRTWKETREVEADIYYWLKQLIEEQNKNILNGVNDDDKQYR